MVDANEATRCRDAVLPASGLKRRRKPPHGWAIPCIPLGRTRIQPPAAADRWLSLKTGQQPNKLPLVAKS